MQTPQNDPLNLSKQTRLVSQLRPDQKILFSCQALKYNDSNKCQNRILLLTDIALYNVEKGENFIKSMMSKLVNFNKKYTIRRKIPLELIEAVTLSNCEGGEFVVHVSGDYDYRLRVGDPEVRKSFVKSLCLQYERITKRKMGFYFKDDITLVQYCTMKADLKNKINRMPKQNRVNLNVQDLVDYQLPGTKFQLLYSQTNKSVSINKFISSSLGKMTQTNTYFSIQPKNSKFSDIKPYLENKHQFINLPHYIFGVTQTQNLYILRPLMIGGKMDKFVSTLGPFKKELCVFYIAQIIIALEFLHSKGWVFRAMSLSNVYVKENGYIALDGLNKLLRRKKLKQQVFFDICGLPQDLAPEMILCSGHNESIDVWGLGICTYNIIQGHHPFLSINPKQTFRNILQKKIQQSQSLPNFVYRALQKDPQKRPTLSQIKKDPCFNGIKWQQIERQTIQAPYVPELKSVYGWVGKLPSVVYLQGGKEGNGNGKDKENLKK